MMRRLQRWLALLLQGQAEYSDGKVADNESLRRLEHFCEASFQYSSLVDCRGVSRRTSIASPPQCPGREQADVP